MTVGGWLRGGWWHDYVCPTHGTELGPPVQDGYPCRQGCRWVGEPFGSAWLALEHQRNARQMRKLADAAAAGDVAAADRALDWLASYAHTYGGIPARHERAQEWMVPGRLFQQALSESIWAAGVASGVWTLSEVLDPARTDRLVREAVPLLTGLHELAAAARQRTELTSNYVAWFDAAGALSAGALIRLGAPPPDAGWIDGPAGVHAHARAAILDDGWEWEGSTYYHAFVVLAYLYALRGTDPADLPADVAGRIVGMIDVLASLATTDGVLPALHDSPYRRPAADEPRYGEHQRIEVCELAEIVALAGQLVQAPALDGLAGWCREVLAGSDDASLLDGPGGPAGWFAGPPLPGRDRTPGSTVFHRAGYAVLRAPDASWLALLDFGPHGGSHGHLDKLALYLYGDRVAWQPDPGVVPYGSRLRHDVYRTTRAHPTFSVDGAEQAECAGRLLRWVGDGPSTVVVAAADHAYPGVQARRHLVTLDGGLLDVLELRADQERALALHLRPAVPVSVRAEHGTWRTAWGGAVRLAARHACSVGSRLELVPGWAPADDPSQPHRWLDWTARAPAAVFATLWLAGHPVEPPLPPSIEATSHAVTVHRPGGASYRYPLTPGEQR